MCHPAPEVFSRGVECSPHVNTCEGGACRDGNLRSIARSWRVRSANPSVITLDDPSESAIINLFPDRGSDSAAIASFFRPHGSDRSAGNETVNFPLTLRSRSAPTVPVPHPFGLRSGASLRFLRTRVGRLVSVGCGLWSHFVDEGCRDPVDVIRAAAGAEEEEVFAVGGDERAELA